MIKFGPSGNSEEFYEQGYKHTEEAGKFLKENGLDCFEYSFGRGVKMTEKTASAIGNAFKEQGVEISAHAPYFVNFANPDDEMAEKSFGYVLDTARACKAMGGKRVVFHPATQGKLSRYEAVELTKKRMQILRDKIYENGLQDMIFSPETMGKIGQIGTVEEIVEFCEIDPVFVPCVDFGHVNAREHGSLNTVEDFESRLKYMVEKLGYDKMKEFHVHFSKIMYSKGGEVKHLTFEDTEYGPEFYPCAVALKNLGLTPYIICESAGTQSIDAKKMKNIYNSLQ